MVIFMTDFDRLCESIFTIDHYIRYVRILGKNGVSLAGRYRNDEIPRYFTNHEINELEQFYYFIWGIAKFHKPRLGDLNCAILEFDKIRKFAFALDDGKLLIVSTNPKASADIKDKIQENITTILKIFSSNLTT